MLWLVLNALESVKTEFRHRQQQQQQERFSKVANITLHPWTPFGGRYWTVDVTRLLREDANGTASPRRTTLPFAPGKTTVVPRAEPLIAAREIGEDEECIERILDDFRLTDDVLSGEILSDREEAQKLASLLAVSPAKQCFINFSRDSFRVDNVFPEERANF